MLEHHDILRTLSEVAAAFAGFTGIIMVLGSRAHGEWRSTDITAVSVLLACSLGVVFYLLGLLWLLLMATYVFALLLLETVSSRHAA